MADFTAISRPNPHSVAAGYGRRWCYESRRGAQVTVIGVHSAEIRADLDGADTTGEAVDNYAANVADRRVSWHDTTDRDSAVHAMPSSWTGFHIGNFNSGSVGIEQGFEAGAYETLPGWARFEYQFTLVLTGTWRAQPFGIPPRRLTQAEAFAGVKGWVDHATMQPTIRTDPGWSAATWVDVIEMAEFIGSGGTVLGLGSTGDAVRRVQFALGVPVDGTFGTLTDDAVRAWETARGLPSTGLWAPWAHGLDDSDAIGGHTMMLPFSFKETTYVEAGGRLIAVETIPERDRWLQALGLTADDVVPEGVVTQRMFDKLWEPAHGIDGFGPGSNAAVTRADLHAKMNGVRDNVNAHTTTQVRNVDVDLDAADVDAIAAAVSAGVVEALPDDITGPTHDELVAAGIEAGRAVVENLIIGP